MNERTSSGSIRYPRGFVRNGVGFSGEVRSQGDEELGILHKTLIGGTVNHQGWTYRDQVLRCAVRLLGNFYAFANQQALNPLLSRYNYEFFIDTLEFIEHGHRRVSIQNWLDLLEEDPKPSADHMKRSRFSTTKTPFSVIGLDTASVVARWCSHPQGFEDLVMSLHVMFGSKRDPRDRFATKSEFFTFKTPGDY